MFADLLKVQIDFSHSHVVFPLIVEVLLLVFALAIVAQRHVQIRAAFARILANATPSQWNFDRKRLFGTLALTIVYFVAMEPVGRLRPNTGIGFLICSCVFCLGLARLLVHDVTPRKWLNIGLTSLIGPGVVWFVFSEVFRVTLP
jgi:hypothetical protein